MLSFPLKLYPSYTWLSFRLSFAFRECNHPDHPEKFLYGRIISIFLRSIWSRHSPVSDRKEGFRWLVSSNWQNASPMKVSSENSSDFIHSTQTIYHILGTSNLAIFFRWGYVQLLLHLKIWSMSSSNCPLVFGDTGGSSAVDFSIPRIAEDQYCRRLTIRFVTEQHKTRIISLTGRHLAQRKPMPRHRHFARTRYRFFLCEIQIEKFSDSSTSVDTVLSIGFSIDYRIGENSVIDWSDVGFLEQQSSSKLELIAAVLVPHLIVVVHTHSMLPDIATHFWYDSQVNLCLKLSDKRKSVLVNRLKQTSQTLETGKWH